jgi:hypothetical protein
VIQAYLSHQTISISNSAKRLGRRFGVSEGKLQASEARTSLGKTGAGLGNLGDSDGGVTNSEHGEDFTAPALELSLLRIREDYHPGAWRIIADPLEY